MLRAGNLEIVWQKELPIKKGEKLKQLIILDGRIYGLSDKNYIFSLNRANGNPIFSKPLTRLALPVLGVGLYDNELFSIIGNRLVEIEPDSGKQLSSTGLKIGVTCPVARNGLFYYVGGTDRRLHTMRVKDKVEVFNVAAENESMISSIIADEDFIVFTTDAGNVISISSDRAKKRWQFDTAGGVIDPIVRDGKWLFISSRDTSVYKVDITTRALGFKYSTGTVLDTGPIVGRKVVYQNVREKGLVAIDKQSGKLIWRLPQGLGLLTESGTKAYVLTRNGTLVVMDNEKAKELYSFNFADISKYVSNVADSKIYIADDRGKIACLQPVK